MIPAAKESPHGDAQDGKGIRIEYQRPLKRLTPAMVARLAAVRDELRLRHVTLDSTEIIEQARANRFDEL